MENKGKFDGICATESCNNPSRWMSSIEVRALGSNAPYRCTTCCDAIGEAFATFTDVQKISDKRPNLDGLKGHPYWGKEGK